VPQNKGNQMSIENFHGREKNWSLVPGSGLMPGHTNPLTVGLQITFTSSTSKYAIIISQTFKFITKKVNFYRLFVR
jgi:hypothetical protein